MSVISRESVTRVVAHSGSRDIAARVGDVVGEAVGDAAVEPGVSSQSNSAAMKRLVSERQISWV